jgi:ribosomal protein S21
MSRANVKVVAKPLSYNPSREERDRNFKWLFTAFKRAVAQSGVLKDYKRHESYESKSQKKRRKKREAMIALLKSKMRESFVDNNGKSSNRPEFDRNEGI